MATVDENRQLDRSGPADVVDGVKGRPDGPPAVEDVVDEHHDGAVDASRGDVGGLERPGRS